MDTSFRDISSTVQKNRTAHRFSETSNFLTEKLLLEDLETCAGTENISSAAFTRMSPKRLFTSVVFIQYSTTFMSFPYLQILWRMFV